MPLATGGLDMTSLEHNRLRGRTTVLVIGVLLACGHPSTLLAQSEGKTNQEAAMKSERNKQIVTAAFDRWAAGGSDFFNELLAPNIVWTIEGSGPSAGTFRGRDEFIARAV